MEELTLDYLPKHPEIKLYQHKKMFRLNTDTALLGEYLDFPFNSRVLDIGVNNGALLLYANMHKPKFMVGIDINKDALDIAKMNFKLNQINNYELINIDANNYLNSEKFDVIISNPPYFVSSEELKNKNEYLKMARHEEFLTLKNLMKIVKSNLKENGLFYLVHRYVRLEEIKKELKNNSFFINKMQIVYDQNKIDPVSIVLKISLIETKIEKNKIVVTRKKSSYFKV